MKIGYARVSTKEQDLGLQIEELKKYGCERIFSEHFTGTRIDRPELQRLLDHLREGDEVAVWRIDRFSRRIVHAHKLIEQIVEKGCTLVSISQGIRYDNSAMSKMMFSQLTIFAEYERDLHVERVREGMARAKENGKPMGRPKVTTAEQRETIVLLFLHGKSIRGIAKQMGISRQTVRRVLNRHEDAKRKA